MVVSEREREVEAWLIRKVEGMGGLCLKWICPGGAGVPDRIVIMPGGYIWFVELKRKGEKPRPLQEYQMDRLRRLGCSVAVVAGMDEAREFIGRLWDEMEADL